MAYHVIDPQAIEPAPDRPCVKRGIADAAGLENVGVNLYEADPGEQIPLAYHYHDEQEEVFYVVDGELAGETPDETCRVPAGTFFVVEPSNPLRAYAPDDTDEPVRVVAVGAPRVDDVHRYEPES